MDYKYLKILEFNKILNKVSERAISSKGKEDVLKIVPMTNLDDIEKVQKETTEATTYILQKGSLPLGGIKDVTHSIKRVEVGGNLSIEELMDIGDFLYVSEKLINYSKSESKHQEFSGLEDRFASIVECKGLKNEINRCIANSYEVHDTATEELFRIRQNIKIQNNRIKEQLNGILHSSQYKNIIQEAVITIRNGRYCVPVKQEYQSSFQGMVHDQSATGATVFIEPLVSVQLNNKIKELTINEKDEINKILIKLSALVLENLDFIKVNQKTITELDVIFAKGEYSIERKCNEPKFNKNKYINIKNGRHPLLNSEEVVATNIYIGEEFNMLLITGPNTGGKTVALKTIGLFTLMGQAGLHIPADENSSLGVFNEIFADIGDEQSIEQSLSTFSSHMKNIVFILNKATNNSLVLLDELGAGTDPIEGAALAKEILKNLKKGEITTVVTTHYSELKMFALSTARVENASCEFNVETLRPSYKILIGVPGKSNAFAISEKLGLPKFIIEGAKDSLSGEELKFEDVITDLEISRRKAKEEEEKAEKYMIEMVKLKEDIENKKQKIEKQREKIMLEAKIQAKNMVQKAKIDMDILVKEFNKQLKDIHNKKGLDNARRILTEKLLEKDRNIGIIEEDKLRIPINKKIKKGDKVYVNTFEQIAEVITSPDNNGNIMVQAGILKMKVNIKDLSESSCEKKSVEEEKHRYVNKPIKTLELSRQIDIRGNTIEEGISKVDKYLDDCFLSNLKEVTIIHGKGSGLLGGAIQKYLKDNPNINNYRYGSIGEGDKGVTIVEFK